MINVEGLKIASLSSVLVRKNDLVSGRSLLTLEQSV